MEQIASKFSWKYLLLSIIFLNIFDGIATFIGLKYGFYIELNVFLSAVYKESPILFLIIKIILPTILILTLVKYLNETLSKFTKVIMIVVNAIYICICIYHVILYIIVSRW